ncbi:MAG: ParM/StbA family protein [Clostridium sp.]
MKLFTLDIGSFNTKINTGEILENRFILDNSSETFGAETITLENNTYFFNKGNFDYTFSKVHKNIEVPLLYALGKAGAEGSINIILHLPASQYNMKNELVEKLQGKSFEYKVNGQDKKITLDTVGVLKEGLAAFYSLPKRNDGLIAIIDIGGRTTDVFTFVNGNPEKEISVSVGTLDYFKLIAAELNGQGQNRKIEDIHKLIQHNIIDLCNFEDINKKFTKSTINEIKIEVENLNDYQIILAGGGSEYFNKYYSEAFKKVEVMNNNIKANCIGAENIGKAKGLDK